MPASASATRLSIIAALTALTLVVGGVWMSLTQFTYARLHIFVLVPTALLVFVPPFPLSDFSDSTVKRTLFILPPVMSVVALTYTIVWDNYLALQNIVTFSPPILGFFVYLPYEEYLWSIDHSLLAMFWTMSIFPIKPVPKTRNRHVWFRISTTLACILLTALGVALHKYGHASLLYLSIALIFMPPVMAIHYLATGQHLVYYPWEWFLGVLVPSVYTILLDRWALHVGVWKISEVHTTGLDLLGFKFEHVLIYTLPTVLIVQSVIITLRMVQVYKVHRYYCKSTTETLLHTFISG